MPTVSDHEAGWLLRVRDRPVAEGGDIEVHVTDRGYGASTEWAAVVYLGLEAGERDGGADHVRRIAVYEGLEECAEHAAGGRGGGRENAVLRGCGQDSGEASRLEVSSDWHTSGCVWAWLLTLSGGFSTITESCRF